MSKQYDEYLREHISAVKACWGLITKDSIGFEGDELIGHDLSKYTEDEYYAYDKQGNILEKRIGNSIYKYIYDTANQLMEMESPEEKREYFYDRAGRLIYVFL